jgi:hypothetical protein
MFVLTCCLSITPAQQPKPAALDKWDIFAGYSFSRASVVSEYPFPLILNGGQASATYFFNKHLGLTGELAGYTNDSDGATFKTEGYLFGPTVRYRIKNSRYSLFAHQLFGVTHIGITADSGEPCGNRTAAGAACTANPFTIASGGGFDVKVSKHLSVRPMQVEYFNQLVSVGALENEYVGNEKIGVEGFRYSGGAVIRF